VSDPRFGELIAILVHLYTDVETARWLTGEHKMLDEKRAIDLIAAGRIDEVIDVAQSMLDCNYI